MERVPVTGAGPEGGITTGIVTVYRIVQAIRKHVVAQHALAGTYKGVGIEEAAPSWVIISALEIIQPGFLVMLVAIEANFGYSGVPGGSPQPGNWINRTPVFFK